MPQFPSMQIPPRMPLVVSAANRDTSTEKDGRLVNCFLETDPETDDIYIIKRPGLLRNAVVNANAAGMGVFNWKGNIYSIFGGVLYKNGAQVATGLDTTNGVYQFSQIQGTTPKLVLGNGVKTYAYDDTGGLTSDLHTIDSNFPATTVKGLAYINGATYVMDSSAAIWGSTINSVSVAGDWDVLDKIVAQIEPDDGVQLSKHLVYVCAFNEWSTEFFFDAGNATGSPLGPVEGAKIGYGCVSEDSVQSIDDALFFLCSNKTSSTQVGMIADTQFRIISTKYIDKLLKGADFSNVMSWQLKMNGHSFYVVTVVGANLTLAYDIIEHRWHQWTDKDGNYFPICASTYDNSGRHVLQHATNGILYYADSDTWMDDQDPIQCDIYTPIWDGQTRRNKLLSQLAVIGDRYPGMVLACRYSDDDYVSWSNFRKIYMDSDYPCIEDEGTFRRRAYNFRHTQDCPMRVQAVELQYDVGVL